MFPSDRLMCSTTRGMSHDEFIRCAVLLASRLVQSYEVGSDTATKDDYGVLAVMGRNNAAKTATTEGLKGSQNTVALISSLKTAGTAI